MAWTTLPTYTDGTAFTAAMALAIAANINETAVAKATTAGGYFVATGTNAIAQRTLAYQSIVTTGTTTSTSYANLGSGGVGPAVTVTTGTAALIFSTAQLENTATGGAVWASFDVGNATVIAADDTFAIMQENPANLGARVGVTSYMVLTAGSNAFTMKYKVASGTGSFDDRRFYVLSL